MTQPQTLPQGHHRIWIDHVSELGASAETVFALLRDIDMWPTWTPGLLSIRRNMQKPLAVGSSFVMVLKPQGAPVSALPCKVLALQTNYMEWGGELLGAAIRHSFAIEPLTPASCRVRQLEYATSWMAVLTSPIVKIAERHDRAWSEELERRFPLHKKAVS